jgi:hypothetical protein
MQVEEDPDANWVEELSGRGPEASGAAIREAQGETRLFAHLSREHRREGRTSYVEIDAPLELHALVRLLRPAHIVEVGVSSGVSSAYLLNALERNGLGVLHSVDLPSLPARNPRARAPPRASWSLPPGRSAGWAVPFPLRKRWDLRLGDKREVLPILTREIPRIDLFVYDVPHEDSATRKEFGLLDPLVGPGGVAIADHGPGGGLCAALASWGRSRETRPLRRQHLGLYGIRMPTSSRAVRSRAPRPHASSDPGPRTR